MSRSGKAFELGGIVVPIHAALDLQQRIEPIGGSTLLRLGQGAAVKQTTWRKRRVTLSASGWCPPGLDALNWDSPLTLKCGLPESITTATASATLPAARRTDAGYEPFARAHLANEWRDTPCSMAGNIATITAVSGVVAYQVWYWPQMTVYAEPPVNTFDQATGQARWELICEEQ